MAVYVTCQFSSACKRYKFVLQLYEPLDWLVIARCLSFPLPMLCCFVKSKMSDRTCKSYVQIRVYCQTASIWSPPKSIHSVAINHIFVGWCYSGTTPLLMNLALALNSGWSYYSIKCPLWSAPLTQMWRRPQSLSLRDSLLFSPQLDQCIRFDVWERKLQVRGIIHRGFCALE